MTPLSGSTAESAIVHATPGGQHGWILQSSNMAMALSLSPTGALLLNHWGANGHSERIEDYLSCASVNRASLKSFLDGVPLAYSAYGDASFKEPCLCAVYDDGTRAIDLIFQEAHTTALDHRPMLELVFTDPVYKLVVTHRFVIYSEHDLIARSVRLENAGKRPIRIERALSASLALPPAQYEVWTLHGQWGREYELQRRRLLPGKFITESRVGFTSHEAHPWFAVSAEGETDEQRGQVWFGSLAWSGNFSLTFEVERNGVLSIVAGIQPFDFTWHLASGESFEAPALVCGYSDEGLGGVSRILHRYETAEVLPLPRRSALRPILYNSWEATKFDVQVDQQLALARCAADLGVELFVVDDGWFGARDSDQAGLGDWMVNPRKFPNGLNQLIEEVHRLGMQFGIWIEPEMVNPDSDLYRSHPDWVFHFENREPTLARNQLVLNCAREDVRRAILDQLLSLLRNHSIDFIKWDHNRPLTDVGWPSFPRERQREAWVRHVLGVYEIITSLRVHFPDLLIESCASGGGRADLGILRLMDQVWVSDNTEASDRLLIQYGYSHAHAPQTMVNWVTDVPNSQTGRESPLDFRFHVAMQGVLGIGGDIRRWTSEELEQARKLVDQYKRIRPVVQQGSQYWLRPPSHVGPSVVQYVSESRHESIILLYQIRSSLGEGIPRIRLRGLDPTRCYRRTSDGVESTGGVLMAAGIPIVLTQFQDHAHLGDWRSEIQVWQALD